MNELQKSNGGLLEKGLEMMKDPNVSTKAKIGAVGIITIGAIAYIGKETIEAMGKQ